MKRRAMSRANPSCRYGSGVRRIFSAAWCWWLRCLRCGRASDLQGMHGFSFGPGTAPRMFAVLLLALGAAVAGVGVVHEGRPCSGYPGAVRCSSWLAILFFALTIRPLGLIVSASRDVPDRRARLPRNTMDRSHHRRHLPDGRMRIPVPLCPGTADAAVPAFPGAVRPRCSSCFKISLSALRRIPVRELLAAGVAGRVHRSVPMNILFCLIGALVGTLVGVLPGIGPSQRSRCCCRSPSACRRSVR